MTLKQAMRAAEVVYYKDLGTRTGWVVAEMAKISDTSRANIYHAMERLKLWRYASEARVVIRKKSKDAVRPDTSLVVGKDPASEPERDTRLPGVRSW